MQSRILSVLQRKNATKMHCKVTDFINKTKSLTADFGMQRNVFPLRLGEGGEGGGGGGGGHSVYFWVWVSQTLTHYQTMFG